MFESTTQVRVRYGETDKMGYAYYGNYMLYYEIARTDALRSLDLTYKELEDDGILMPVLDLQSKYIKPAFYDELLTIKTTIEELPGVRIHFKYEVFNESNDLLNIGNTTLVFIDAKSKKPCSPPDYFMDKMKPFFR